LFVEIYVLLCVSLFTVQSLASWGVLVEVDSPFPSPPSLSAVFHSSISLCLFPFVIVIVSSFLGVGSLFIYHLFIIFVLLSLSSSLVVGMTRYDLQ